MTDTEPNCPARLARFRLECTDTVCSTSSMLAEPQTPLPCVESIERPGRCVHCYQAIERAPGAPHGPYCTGDSRCRECARLQREAVPPPAENREWREKAKARIPPVLSPAVLNEWRADADRWARFGVMPADETRVGCQRIATLIDALNDATADLQTFDDIEGSLEQIRSELERLTSELQRRLAAAGHRPPFSMQPVPIAPPRIGSPAAIAAEKERSTCAIHGRRFDADGHCPACDFD